MRGEGGSSCLVVGRQAVCERRRATVIVRSGLLCLLCDDWHEGLAGASDKATPAGTTPYSYFPMDQVARAGPPSLAGVPEGPVVGVGAGSWSFARLQGYSGPARPRTISLRIDWRRL
jgi:hypothetical protein